MKIKLLTAFLMLFISLEFTYGQVSITNAAPTATVNFSNTMQTSVGSNPSTAYAAAGFEPNPTTPGRLNSNAWEVKGWSFGNCLFGGTQTVDDYSRGPVTGGVVTPGMYVYTELPGSVGNPAMMIQPGPGDFDPGTVALRIRNNGTTNLTQLSVDYNLFVRNDENTSSAFNFSHSADNIVYVNEPVLDYVSPDVLDAFQWVAVGTAPSRTCVINGLNIPPGGYYYIRWSSFLVTGTGDADEFGLDDIRITGTYGAPAPEINLTCYGNTLLSGDTTPTVAEGTDFAPSYAPMSTLLTTLQISYYIQNLGGLPLNITNITITGANASDFVFSGTTTGTIPAASATISTKQFTVIFDPSGAGLRTARVNIFSNDSDENPYWFDIQGYGVIPIPDIRINGGPTGGLSIVTSGSMIPNINNNTLYSNQVVGGPGETKGFVIRNDCPQNAPLLLTDASPFITIGGNNPADFVLMTWPANNVVNPGFTKNFTIKFAPTGTGIRNAIVSIASNDPDENPYTFLVQGTGVAAEMDVTGNAQPIISGSTTPSFVNHTFFDYLNINTGTLDRTFTITNSGTVALTLGAMTLTGTNAADFAIMSGALPATLAAGATVTFTIRFDPSAVGLRQAVVNIVNSDPNENPYTFAISGFGLDYIPCALGAVETIGLQDFEAAPATPVWAYTSTGTVAVAGGTAFAATGDGGASARFLGGRSLQVVNGTGIVTMSNINTTQFNDVELNFRLASLSVTNLEGADATDRVMVAISTNGTAGPWSNELEVVGNTDAKWNFTSGTGTATMPYDGNNVVVTFNPGAGGFLTTNGYSTVSVSGLPKSATLAVRITIANNSVNEIWAVDNVSLFGRREVSTTWAANVWTPSVPTPTVKAIIDGNYDTAINGNISSCKCVIRTGRTVTINTNNYFDIQSDIDNSGTLIIENGGSLVQRNDLATNIGSITVKRNTTNMRSFDYTYWSSPVTGQTLVGLSPTTLWDKYFSFNPTTGLWAVIPNGTDVMLPGKGYIIRAPQSFTTTGQSFLGVFNGVPNNGFIQTPIVLGTSNMNLIGNPYPSAISANAFLSNSANTGVVEGTIYLWTHNTAITAGAYTANDYAVWNFSGSVATRPALTTGVNTGAPTGNIASGQSFFIKGLANGQATFNNSMRLTGTNMNFFRNANGIQTATNDMAGIERNRVWLNLSNTEGAFKQTLVGYIEGATNEIDRGFDGELFNANAFVSLYSIANGTNLAIQGRALPFNEDDKIVLGYNSTIAGVFNISIENTDGFMSEENIYLEDKLLNVIHDLKQAPYSFETAAGTFNTRFELRYTNSVLGTDGFATAGNAIIVTTNNKQIDIFSQHENMKNVVVYDLLGRNIFESDKVNAMKLSIPNAASNQQALIVKITLDNGKVVTRKVVL